MGGTHAVLPDKDVGKGIGQRLAIAQDIVVGKHHGMLTLESEVGRGSTFIVCLSLKQQAPEDQAN